MTSVPSPEVLRAPLVVEFPFTRSLGPVQSAFLTGLRERTVLGVRTGDGRTLVPPVEYDPVTAEEIRDLVEVATTGTVTTWAWNHAPRRGQPLDTPFAWVLVRLDGADTALLHALDVPGPDAV
ncbi:DNA-binding protein, partial [Streptomyces sp. SID10116]|nr:DNA-binding protein [Streptomyces sp. SID10116]